MFKQKRNTKILRLQNEVTKVLEKIRLTSIFPFPKLFKGWLGFVPPIDPTNTICFTPAALAVYRDKAILIS